MQDNYKCPHETDGSGPVSVNLHPSVSSKITSEPGLSFGDTELIETPTLNVTDKPQISASEGGGTERHGDADRDSRRQTSIPGSLPLSLKSDITPLPETAAGPHSMMTSTGMLSVLQLRRAMSDLSSDEILMLLLAAFAFCEANGGPRTRIV